MANTFCCSCFGRHVGGEVWWWSWEGEVRRVSLRDGRSGLGVGWLDTTSSTFMLVK